MGLRSALSWLMRPEARLFEHRDYERYRQVQNEGNARKFREVFAKEKNVHYLARYVMGRAGPPGFVLCHGSRNGAEVAWFKSAFPAGTRLLGTDIGDTAKTLADTIQWDFHEVREDWIGATDVIYSNSWDHAYDPEKCFRAWLSCLTPKGLMLIEHHRTHEADKTSELDCFGTTRNGLRKMLNTVGAGRWKVVDEISDLPLARRGLRVMVVGSVLNSGYARNV